MRFPASALCAFAYCSIPSLAFGQTPAPNIGYLPSRTLVPVSGPTSHQGWTDLGLNTPQMPAVVEFNQPLHIRRVTSPPDNSLLIQKVKQHSAFELRILIHLLSAPDVEIKAELGVGKSFFKKVSSDFQGVGFNRVMGGVRPPSNGIYPVSLLFFDATGLGGSLEDQVTLMLTPGKPYQRTFEGGAVCYTVTLINLSP